MARVLAILALGIGFGLQTRAANFSFPQGQREALMGNVGIALNGSEGAAIYNPAGLATLGNSRISVSGSLLNISQSKASVNSAIKTEVDADNEALSLSQIPGMVAGYTQTSSGVIGYFFNTNASLSFEKFIEINSSHGTNYTVFGTNLSSLHIGGAWAHKTTLSDRWSLQYGLTLGAIMNDHNSRLFSKTKNNLTGAYTSSFQNKLTKTINATARAGVLLDSPDSAYGLYIQPEGGRLSSSYSRFAYSASTDGTVQDDSAGDGPDVKTPMDVGLGVALKKWKNWNLFYDANYSQVRESQEAESSSLVKTVIQGLGCEYTLSSGTSLFTGLTHAKKFQEDYDSEGFLWSGGFNYSISFLKNYVGLYASEERGTLGWKMNFFGVMLGTQYSY